MTPKQDQRRNDLIGRMESLHMELMHMDCGRGVFDSEYYDELTAEWETTLGEFRCLNKEI